MFRKTAVVHTDKGHLVSRVSHEHWTRLVGGGGGRPFTYKYEEGHGKPTDFIIKRITVWANEHFLRGIKVENSVGDTAHFGRLEGKSHSTFTFKKGEIITRLQLWDNERGQGTRCGGIRFETNTNRVFNAEPSEKQNSHVFVQDVQSGIMAGIFGRHGMDIDSLGFIFKVGMVRTSIPCLGLD